MSKMRLLPLPRVTPRIRFLHLLESGGASRDRTDDLKLAKLALSQLSYGPSANVDNVHSGEQAFAADGGPRRS